MLLIVAWLIWLTSHFHVENLKKNVSLNVNLQKKKSTAAMLLPKYSNTQVNSLLNASMVFLFLSLQVP